MGEEAKTLLYSIGAGFAGWVGHRLVIRPIDNLTKAIENQTIAINKLCQDQGILAERIETLRKTVSDANIKMNRHDRQLSQISFKVMGLSQRITVQEKRMQCLEKLVK